MMQARAGEGIKKRLLCCVLTDEMRRRAGMRGAGDLIGRLGIG